MGNNKKKHKKIYGRGIKTYKYNSDYKPYAMYDSMLDKALIYVSSRPSFNKNDYSAPMRSYKKEDGKET